MIDFMSELKATGINSAEQYIVGQHKTPQHIYDQIKEIETGVAPEKLKELITLLKNHMK